jgi:NAD(P)-dependent dehydrogenase (short-subunit alcohol dehydrogenase family)
MELFELRGKLALVTGAGTGIGQQAALTLAAAGATVIVAARRLDKLEETVEKIRAAGGDAAAIALDVTDAQSISDCFARCKEEHGVLDILVNNAGIARQSYIAEHSEADWDDVLDTNLKGVMLVGQAAARDMIAAGKGGAIINVASVLGFGVAKTLAAYGAAKAGVVSLTKTMALEWARFGIRVNAIAPGYFLTDINRRQLADPAAKEYLSARIPLKRIGNLPELAGPVLLLASNAGSYMTGSTLTIDGGQLCNIL